MWTHNLTRVEDQGLWIQAMVLRCSCAKAASERALEREGDIMRENGRGRFRERYRYQRGKEKSEQEK